MDGPAYSRVGKEADAKMDSPASVRPTYARVDLGAIAFNYDQIRTHVGPEVGVLAVVKADAYGHGALPVARCLTDRGVQMLGVAIAEEALTLRDGGIGTPILVLGQILPAQAPGLVERDVRVMVSDVLTAEACSAAARRGSVPARVHVKIDTGMGRLGVVEDRAVQTIRRIAALDRVVVEGVATHFSSAGDADPSFTYAQIEAFRAVLSGLQADGLTVPWVHAANSAAALTFRESRFNLVRPGLALYGLMPSPTLESPIELRPALSLHTRVVFVKDLPAGRPVSYGRAFTTQRATRAAVITIGYDDGYTRQLGHHGWVRIRGRLCPVIGRVCMDQCVVDATGVPGVRAGDEVTVYEADRRSPIGVERIAEQVETVPHEVLCLIGRRVPRVYVDSLGLVDLDTCTRMPADGRAIPLSGPRRSAG